MTTKTPTQLALAKLQRAQVKEGHKTNLFIQLDDAKLPHPVPEYQFHSTRKWSIDFAWPKFKLALEVEGGVYQEQGGGHRSVSGFESNLEKYNALAVDRWYLIRVTPEMLGLRNGKAIILIKQFFGLIPK